MTVVFNPLRQMLAIRREDGKMWTGPDHKKFVRPPDSRIWECTEIEAALARFWRDRLEKRRSQFTIMKTYRIVMFQDQYFPQYRRWFRWHNLIPEGTPPCGDSQTAANMIQMMRVQRELLPHCGNVVEYWTTDGPGLKSVNNPADDVRGYQLPVPKPTSTATGGLEADLEATSWLFKVLHTSGLWMGVIFDAMFWWMRPGGLHTHLEAEWPRETTMGWTRMLITTEIRPTVADRLHAAAAVIENINNTVDAVNAVNAATTVPQFAMGIENLNDRTDRLSEAVARANRGDVRRKTESKMHRLMRKKELPKG